MLPFFFDRAPGQHSTTFLAGVGRSGTTWVADIINACNDHRLMFEPFYPQQVPACRGFRYRQYLRQDNADPRYLSVANLFFSGRLRNKWVDKHNKAFIASRRLIKDIRANLLLAWLHAHFPNVRIVLLLRHPCAVALSKVKAGWGTHLNEFLDQPDLLTDFLAPFKSTLESADGDFEKHVLLWCVENYVPLKQFQRGTIYVVFYENLCINPHEEFEKLFAFLELKLTKRHLSALNKPSAVSSSTSAISTGESLVDSWKKGVSRNQTEATINILSKFGLSRIYGEGALPLIASDSVDLKSASGLA